MSETETEAGGPAAGRAGRTALGPGLLVLVVGPGAAVKDTLLAYARARLDVTRASGMPIHFARRRITRAADATEDHERIDEAAFARAVAMGAFPLHWRANGLSYALGPEVAEAIEAGGLVVANGSRAAIARARGAFARIKVVHVSAAPQVLAARIAARGRESGEEVLARLAREPVLDGPPDVTILNDGAVEPAGERLAAYLRELAG